MWVQQRARLLTNQHREFPAGAELLRYRHIRHREYARPHVRLDDCGWWILDEPELHLHDDVVVPDLAGWRGDRMPAIPDAAALTLPPDWVCEVVSPSTEALDRGRKLDVYAREGVAHAWLSNPANETLEAFALSAGRWTLIATHVGSATVRVQPFAAVELDLSALWLQS